MELTQKKCILAVSQPFAEENYIQYNENNCLGSISARAYLEVQSLKDSAPPVIGIGPTNQTLPLGTEARLPCKPVGKSYILYYKKAPNTLNLMSDVILI